MTINGSIPANETMATNTNVHSDGDNINLVSPTSPSPTEDITLADNDMAPNSTNEDGNKKEIGNTKEESAKETDNAEEADSINKTEIMKEQNNIQEADSTKESNNTMETDTANEANNTKETDTTDEVVNSKETDKTREASTKEDDMSDKIDNTSETIANSTAENNETAENFKQIMIDYNKKPVLVLTAPPVMGHTTPLLRLAKQMIRRGFEVIFMSTMEFKKAIEKSGAEFYESMTPFADIEYLKSRHTLSPGLPTLMADMENMFIKQMAPRSSELRSALETIRERDPSRNVVIITETMSLAPMPFIYGAPLPKGYDTFPKTININTVPIMILSMDTGIAGSGLPPDASESGRARNKFINEMVVRGPFSGTDRVFHQALKDLGCTSLPAVFFQNAWLESYDTTFQLCVPSLEYPRSDLHLSIRFSGALPKGEADPAFQYPSWWAEIKSNPTLPASDRKKIVAVAQGTVALDYDDLIIPTLKALAKRPDVIVVTILGVKGASLPITGNFEAPDNARIIDFLPYDSILEYADIFVTNGGYGGLSHGVLNGVPMILAGTSEDKAEVCARGAYAGFAINLNVQKPTSEQIYEASEKIFTDPMYKHRALRLMQENEDLDAISIIERQVLKYATLH